MFNSFKFILLFFMFITCPVSSYKMIVLTGGPCGGKSSSLPILKNKLESSQNGNKQFKVFTINETASSLFEKGINPEKMGIKDFQMLVFSNQIENENNEILKSREFENKNPNTECIIVCDRGLLDGAAYMKDEDYNEILDKKKFTKQKIFERYDAIIYLPSFATLDDNSYNDRRGNRVEKKEEAKKLDEKICNIWRELSTSKENENSKFIKIDIREGIDERSNMIFKKILELCK